jgi:hypothetical protein
MTGRLLRGLAVAYVALALVTGVAQLSAPAVAPITGAAMWACAVLAAIVVIRFAVARAQAVAPHRVCSYCRTSVPETQGYICAGQRFACDACCASDVRAIVLPREVA